MEQAEFLNLIAWLAVEVFGFIIGMWAGRNI